MILKVQATGLLKNRNEYVNHITPVFNHREEAILEATDRRLAALERRVTRLENSQGKGAE